MAAQRTQRCRYPIAASPRPRSWQGEEHSSPRRSALLLLGSLLGAAISLLHYPACVSALNDPVRPITSFVRRSGTQLLLDGAPYYFVGCNAYHLVDDAGPYGNTWRVGELFRSAQKLGLRVVRTWAFNRELPAPGPTRGTLRWSEEQFRGLDYIVQQAGQYGIRLVLTLGNLWPAYVGPEVFLAAANGGLADNATVYEFYADPGARELYRQHLIKVITRVNTYTGVQYSADPVIMMYDVMNEPRCPGCMSSDMRAVYTDWLSVMSSVVAAAAPNQLVAMGTEGFFADTTEHGFPSFVRNNPGAGSACEGEDWIGATKLPQLSVGVTHVYWRQTEGQPYFNWTRMTYEQYIPWFLSYTALHTTLAGQLGKPVIMEEFNLLKTRFTYDQVKLLFWLALNRLAESAEAGGPFAGAMFWSGTLAGSNDDGYNVDLDRVPGNLEQQVGELQGLAAGAAAGAAAAAAAGNGTAAAAAPAGNATTELPLPSAAQTQPVPTGDGTSTVVVAPAASANGTSTVVVAPAPSANGTSTVVVAPAPSANGTSTVVVAPAPSANGTSTVVVAPAPSANGTSTVVVAPAPSAGGTPTVVVAPAASDGGAPTVVVAPSASNGGSSSSTSSPSGGGAGGGAASVVVNGADATTTTPTTAASGGGGGGRKLLMGADTQSQGATAGGLTEPCYWVEGEEAGGGSCGGGASRALGVGGGGSGGGDGGGGMAAAATPSRRRLHEQAIQELDFFRRGGPRSNCAEAAAPNWYPEVPPPGPDITYEMGMLAPYDIVAVIAAATERINRIGGGPQRK